MCGGHLCVEDIFEWRTYLSGEHIWVEDIFELRTYLSGGHIWVENIFEWRTYLSGEHIWVEDIFELRTYLSGGHIWVEDIFEWRTYLSWGHIWVQGFSWVKMGHRCSQKCFDLYRSVHSRTSQLRIDQTRRHAYQLHYHWSKQNEGSAVASLKHTIENIFADMHVMNTVCFLFFFHRRLFFALGARDLS